MIAESQIRAKLGSFLSKDMSLDRFEDWLVQQSWNMHKDSSESAQKLASAIELRLAEYSSGHLDEAGLRDELREFVNSYTLHFSFELGDIPSPAEEPPNNVIADPKPLVVSQGAVLADRSPAAAHA